MERIMGKLRKRKRSHLDVASTAENGSKTFWKYLAKFQISLLTCLHYNLIILDEKICSAQWILVLTRATLFKAGESLIQLSINLVHSLPLLFDMQIPWIIVRCNIILKKDREVSLKLLVLFNYSVIAKWKNDFIFSDLPGFISQCSGHIC